MEITFTDPKVLILSIVLSISSVITILDYAGLLPRFISKWLTRNRVQPTLDVLRELGLDVDRQKRISAANSVPEFYPGANLEATTKEQLSHITMKVKGEVGSVNKVAVSSFVDLMGASTDPAQAQMFARRLATFWRAEVQQPNSIKWPDVDFVVTPKSGSPLLGYEFAKILNRPFVLHSAAPKYSGAEPHPAQFFDCAKPLKAGGVALIVDDSTTGGAKVADLIDHLREFGYSVADCLVVFEPTVKKPRTLLESKGVQLHSIVKI